MNHDSWLERADIYALGALDGEEFHWFEDHLSTGCPECEQRVREAREAAVLLVETCTPRPAPPAVKQRLLRSIGPDKTSTSPRRWIAWTRVALTTAAIAAGIVLGFLVWDNQTKQQLLDEASAEIVKLKNDIGRRKQIYRLLEDRSTRSVLLVGQPASPSAVGRVFWHPKDNFGVLITKGLAEAPSDKTYVLWMISELGPRSAGHFKVHEFKVDQFGRAQVHLPPLDSERTRSAKEFAVTLESTPVGDVPAGPMCLLGSFTSTDPV